MHNRAIRVYFHDEETGQLNYKTTRWHDMSAEEQQRCLDEEFWEKCNDNCPENLKRSPMHELRT